MKTRYREKKAGRNIAFRVHPEEDKAIKEYIENVYDGKFSEFAREALDYFMTSFPDKTSFIRGNR